MRGAFYFFFFFFQAEDGIRDVAVTGVQTCALPIAWVLAAAKCGAEDGFAMIGGSAIVAPTGEIAARALSEEDEVIAVDLDLELGDYLRRTVFNFAKHRR